MMGFLGGRGRRRVARAEKRLRESPTPEAYISLARVCLDAGLGERALEVLRRGREQFPDSAELALFHDEVCWSHLRQRARELQARIDREPRPSDVVALARLFLQAGDLSRALDTLTRGAAQFADDVQVNLELAALRFRLWRRDLLAADGLEVLEHIRTVLAVEPTNVEARVLRAELLVRIGAFAEALEDLELLADSAGELLDEDARLRLETLAEAARARRAGQREHDLERLLEEVEASRRPVFDPDRPEETPGADDDGVSTASAVEREALVEEARRLADLPAVRAVLVRETGPEAETLALVGREADPAVKATLEDVLLSAGRACERIRIGRLTEATISCRTGSVAMGVVGEVAVALLCEAECRPREAEERLAGLRAALAVPHGVDR